MASTLRVKSLAVLQRSAVPGPGGATQQEWAALLEEDQQVHIIPELGNVFRVNIGESKARRQFEDEPGVLHLFAPGDRRPAIRGPGWVFTASTSTVSGAAAGEEPLM